MVSPMDGALEHPPCGEPFAIVLEVERLLACLFVIELNGTCRQPNRQTAIKLGSPVVGRAHEAGGVVRVQPARASP